MLKVFFGRCEKESVECMATSLVVSCFARVTYFVRVVAAKANLRRKFC